MSAAKQAYFTEMPVDVPLSDCTTAVGNAENISRARPNGGKKGMKTQDFVKRLLLQQVQLKELQDTVSRRPAPLSLPTPGNAASPTVMSPYASTTSPARAFPTTPSASPNRCHNPYSPIKVEGCDMSAEESFYASYSETFTSSADISAISEASDVSMDQHVMQAILDTHKVSRRRTNTSQATSPASPQRQTPLPRSQTNVAASANVSESHSTSASSSTPGTTRVVRTVVGCSVDRASGRPIPRFVVNNGTH